MQLPIYQVDAFTKHLFSGNPAAVCPLTEWLDTKILQNIAMENNLSETVFFVKDGKDYEIRWFTPLKEVDLCGHATLAAAYVIFNHLNHTDSQITFTSQSGLLLVTHNKEEDIYHLDFPARPPKPTESPAVLLKALGGSPIEVLKARDYFVVYETEQEIRDLKPNFHLLKKLDALGVIVTAKGDKSDFVSRFFAPNVGINEDPVTGSAHCSLIPYWSKKLMKNTLHAQQLSQRGGELYCGYLGNRVSIGGQAVTFMIGSAVLKKSQVLV